MGATTALGAWALPGRDGWDRRRRVGGAVARGGTTATTTSRCAGARMTSRCTTMRGGDWSETGNADPTGSSGAVVAQDDTDPVAPKQAVEPLTRRSSDRAARGRVECWGEGRAWGSRCGMSSCPTRSSDQLSVVRLGAAPRSSGSTGHGRPLDGARARCAFASDPCGWTFSGAASWQGDVDVVGPGRLSMPPLGGAATLEGVWTTRFGVCLASAYCSPSRHERPRPARAVHEAAAGVRQEDEAVPPNRGFDSERESG